MPSPHDHRRDRELLARLASGTAEALAELYDRHAGPLFRHALVLTRRSSDAEDLVQAVFLKLATTGAELLGVREPASYLHRMLRTGWIDRQRRMVTDTRVIEQEAPAWLEPRQGAPDDAIDLARALDGLAPAEREAIVLHLVEGFSFREIGSMTGVSLFTSAGRYRSGVIRLRKSLGAHRKSRTDERP